jgi:RNA polymerase sigma-70 factor (ECF subfamily)
LIHLNPVAPFVCIVVATGGMWHMNRTTDPFRTLYDANLQPVRRMLTRIVGAQDAEDLTQTVFAKAARSLPEFRGDAEPSTWLHRIAANAASDWLRSRSAHEAGLTVRLPDAADDDVRAAVIGAAEVDRQPSPEQQLSQREMRECLRGEIGKLPEPQRTVFMLSALGGLADEDIARTLGISQDNAKVRLHRARQAFKKLIAARCDFYRNELSCKPASPDCCPPAQPSAGDAQERS